MYVGIEGSSYVGKTTAAEQLSTMGYSTVPEYDKFGPFPQSDGSAEGFKAVIDELLEREKQRTAPIDSSDLKPAFADRTPISLITFEDMRIVSSDDTNAANAHRAARDYAITRIDHLSKKGDIVLPDRIAILRIKDKSEFERRVHRRGVTAVGDLALFSTQLYISERAREYAELFTYQHVGEIVDVDYKEPADIAQNLIDFATRPLQ